jgi:hypothetical protein
MADGGLSELFAGRAALFHFFERQRCGSMAAEYVLGALAHEAIPGRMRKDI